jgi:predicted lipid-binding transport protein (Tim44 family)
MGSGFGLFDILLFGMLAVFLVFRLRNVLGKRTGNERRRDNSLPQSDDPRNADSRNAETDMDNVIALPDNAPMAPVQDLPPLEAGLMRIQQVDNSFDPNSFVDGAQAAFEMIVEAYATGDGKTLNTLLSEEVYENFASAIRSRELANHTQETTLVGINGVDLLEAELEDGIASVTVKLVSEQIKATLDENENVVDGDRTAVIQVTDIWTYARDTRSSNPNWKLVVTRSSS